MKEDVKKEWREYFDPPGTIRGAVDFDTDQEIDAIKAFQEQAIKGIEKHLNFIKEQMQGDESLRGVVHFTEKSFNRAIEIIENCKPETK